MSSTSFCALCLWKLVQGPFRQWYHFKSTTSALLLEKHKIATRLLWGFTYQGKLAFWLRVPIYHGCNSLVCSFSCPSRCLQPHGVSIEMSKWHSLPMTILLKLGRNSTNTPVEAWKVLATWQLRYTRAGSNPAHTHTHTDTLSHTDAHTLSLLVISFLTNAHKLPGGFPSSHAVQAQIHIHLFLTHTSIYWSAVRLSPWFQRSGETVVRPRGVVRHKTLLGHRPLIHIPFFISSLLHSMHY